LPLVGNVPKGAAIAGAGAAVVVTGYLIYRNKKASTIDTAYGYGGAAAASGYGYGYGSYYAYGSEYGYGGYGTGAGGGGYTPYPVGAEYGYGAYGYGYYNPYTGQWIGPTQQQPPTKPPPKPTPHKKGKWVTVAGRREYYNPNKQTLGYYVGKGKKRHWVKTKI
jgi:hypothetical protein